MKDLRPMMRSALLRARKYARDNPRHAGIGLIAVAVLSIYTLSKAFEAEKKVINVSREGKFEGKRIIGDAAVSVDRAKEAAFMKTASELIAEQKATGAKLDKLAEIIQGRLPEKVTSTESVGGEGASVSSEPPETHATPQVLHESADQFKSEVVLPQYRYGTHKGREGSFTPSGSKSLRGPAVISFPAVEGEKEGTLGVALPSGSYVKAKLLTGVDSPAGRTDPVLAQLDYAYILPNRHKLDLSGCFMILKTQGDLSSESTSMQPTKMSCVARSGRFFERGVNGYVVDDKDNVFGVRAEVRSKQDRMASMAFISSVVEGVGKAIQQVQTTQQTTPLGGSQTVLTGDEGKYLVAGGASNAASVVTQWYLKQAENLLPTLKVGSGRDVWVVMLDSVSLPRNHFRKGNEHENRFSYVTRLLD